ncbi:hypothetical protein ANO11243_027610 [Dothideomycetidae sp. 11243]|nr:hypothetical protein ANO11243_027610 [fungal sp. No.11243]
MAARAMPVLLCGKTVGIGRIVARGLMPEYEVVHFSTPDTVKDDVPALLAGKDAPASSAKNDVGTGNRDTPPRVVILGKAFTAESAGKIRETCHGPDAEKAAWVVGDPDAPVPPPPYDDSYAVRVTADVKKVLNRWREQGEKDGETLYW